MPTVYLTVEQLMEARALALEATDDQHAGGMKLGEIQSILEHLQNDDYYPRFEDKLTHLFFGLTKGHCFLDGNKRTAAAATMYMLMLNGHDECADTFMNDMENIVVSVADNKIGRDLLRDILAAAVRLELNSDEALKTRILEAITPKEDA